MILASFSALKANLALSGDNLLIRLFLFMSWPCSVNGKEHRGDDRSGRCELLLCGEPTAGLCPARKLTPFRWVVLHEGGVVPSTNYLCQVPARSFDGSGGYLFPVSANSGPYRRIGKERPFERAPRPLHPPARLGLNPLPPPYQVCRHPIHNNKKRPLSNPWQVDGRH